MTVFTQGGRPDKFARLLTVIWIWIRNKKSDTVSVGTRLCLKKQNSRIKYISSTLKAISLVSHLRGAFQIFRLKFGI